MKKRWSLYAIIINRPSANGDDDLVYALFEAVDRMEVLE